MNRRRAGILVAQTLFGAALLWIWLRAVDLSSIAAILSQARWWLVVVAGILGLASGATRVMRWRIVLRPIAKVPFLNLYAIAATAALANFLVPLRTGEAAKGLLLKNRHGASFAAALPTVAIDRSFDLLAILALGAGGALLGVRLNGEHSAIIVLGGAVLIAFFGAVAFAVLGRERLVGLLRRWMPSRVEAPVRKRVVGTVDAFLRGFSTAWWGRKDLSSLLLLTAVATVLDASALYFLFAAVGTPAPVPIMATGFALLTLTWIVPAAPAYIGSTEAFGSLIFTGLGLRPELAASAILLNHAVITVMVTSVGIVGVWALKLWPISVIRSVPGAATPRTTDIVPRSTTIPWKLANPQHQLLTREEKVECER